LHKPLKPHHISALRHYKPSAIHYVSFFFTAEVGGVDDQRIKETMDHKTPLKKLRDIPP